METLFITAGSIEPVEEANILCGKRKPMDHIKISVIVPVYNTEKYLRQCLDSILSQTLQELEVICIDDGSTDSSPAILDAFCRKDSRVRILHKENDGLGAARNSGIGMACGDYIGFVDSDDFVAPDMFRSLYLRAKDTGADVVVGNIFLYQDHTKEQKPYRNQELYKALGACGSFHSSSHPEIVEWIGGWDRIYRRDFLVKYNLRNPEHVIYEDALFSFQTSVLSKCMAVCPEAVYYYRKNTGTAITDREIQNDSYKFDFLKNGAAIREFLNSQGNATVYLPCFLRYLLTNALWHQSNIVKWHIFQAFFQDARQLLLSPMLSYTQPGQPIGWKARVYLWMLRRNLSLLCYVMFYIKKLRRKRRLQNGGEQ